MHLRVATFNTWAGPPVPWLWGNRVTAATRTPRLCDAVADLGADVVLLQEVCSPVLQQALTHRFGADFHVLHSRQRVLWPVVLTVLFPLIAWAPRVAVSWLLLCWALRHEACVEWWRCAGLTMLLRRSHFSAIHDTSVVNRYQSFWARVFCRPRTRQVVRAWLRLRGESIDIHNLHLDPACPAEQFSETLDRRASSDVVMMGGDFNRPFHSDKPLRQALTWVPQTNPLIAPQRLWLSAHDLNTAQALDHILMRSNVPHVTSISTAHCVRHLDTKKHACLSDHYAVVADLDIVNAGPPPSSSSCDAAAPKAPLRPLQQQRTPKLLA
jgi:endonuclease/exonuclease/phosphatase family metal-dependent hydrolase